MAVLRRFFSLHILKVKYYIHTTIVVYKLTCSQFTFLYFHFLACKEEQVKCEKVLADYAILLKLVKLTDHVFGITLQSYYGSQVFAHHYNYFGMHITRSISFIQLMNMCFELYYLARSGIYSESSLDIIGALVVLVQNLYIFFTVSLDAAYVNEEATRGWEILRRRGISPLDSVHKKYMVLINL